MHPFSRPALALIAAGAALTLAAGCTAADDAPGSSPAPSTPEPPQLSEAITLDFYASLLADNDTDRALVADAMGGRLVAVGADGAELWTHQAQVDMDRPDSVAAYSHGETVIVDDGTGRLRALDWGDGSEAWTYTPADADLGCTEPGDYYSSSSTGTSALGEDGIILLEYGMIDADRGSCTGDEQKAMVLGLDPASGQPAWPAVQATADAQPMGGANLQITPDRTRAYLPWRDGDGSFLTHLDLASGQHATVDLSAYGEQDLGFGIYPQKAPGTLVYAFGTADPDAPYSGSITRTALLRLPMDLPESSGVLTPLSAADDPGLAAGIDFSEEPVDYCAAPPVSTASSTFVCASTQLFASRILVLGSLLDGEAWHTDISEDAFEFGLFDEQYGRLHTPVDGTDAPLVIMPGLDAGVRAVSATDGSTLWEAGEDLDPLDPVEGSYGFGGNGALPQLGLIPVLLNDAVHFFTLDGKEHAEAHAVGQYAEASATGRWFAAAAGESTTLWTVTGG